MEASFLPFNLSGNYINRKLLSAIYEPVKEESVEKMGKFPSVLGEAGKKR